MRKETIPAERLTLRQHDNTPWRLGMDSWQVIRRAAWITRRYPTLWPFGFLVVLIGGAAAYPQLFLVVLRWSLPVESSTASLSLPGGSLAAVLALAAWLGAAAVASYLSEGAMVRMVGEIERSGLASIEQGVRAAWGCLTAVLRIALLTGLPVGIVFAQCSAPAALPFLWPSPEASAITEVICSLWPMAALVTLPLAAAMNLPYEFILRRCLLEGRPAGAAIREGPRLLRRSLGRAAPLWLTLLGAGLAAGLLLTLLNLLGLFAVIRVASTLWAAWHSLAAATLSALPCFLLLVVAFSFLHGLYLVFYSAAWTVAYHAVTESEEAATPLPTLVLLRA